VLGGVRDRKKRQDLRVYGTARWPGKKGKTTLRVSARKGMRLGHHRFYRYGGGKKKKEPQQPPGQGGHEGSACWTCEGVWTNANKRRKQNSWHFWGREGKFSRETLRREKNGSFKKEEEKRKKRPYSYE